MKKALITGINGQDGSYLAELLLSKGSEVHGLVRRVSSENHLRNINHIEDKITLFSCDIRSYEQIVNVIAKENYDEIYHLASQSFVFDSFKDPFTTYETNFKGTMNILEAIKNFSPSSKLYFAATSEMFGEVSETPQKESTSFNPQSPYGVSKLAGFEMCRLYRKSYKLFIACGILFNHESPRRGNNFVTKKIINHLNNVKNGTQEFLELGNINAVRDWGHSKDFVYAMYLMLQQDKGDDFVVSTNEPHTVREFAEITATALGYNIKWSGTGVDEIGTDEATNKVIVKINPKFYRPADVNLLQGDYSKAHKILNWEPKINFDGMIKDILFNKIT